ncbi:Pimeloyl-ACP methyl ester carboxylesterase [Geodermatophilus obscurus]|uniref:Pimeloyl-ACP methyl ester carboxylesterase n=1 Tax=Geodermatophilus obscurus TaxID=1861 RepID=A0A1M7UVP5_9ACTN|nr:alpha/beta fold hydrolase [Geodermatophilus obscurus]SHN87018.1 Pimeloyl-ACP methyl ester carboxylesterase [Geodermatophilus obscurus]
MTVQTARSGGLAIAYEVLGEPDGEPLLLVMGLGAQMVGWPDGFCTELVARGFRVVRFDNRDVGLSTHLDGPVPKRAWSRVPATYTLSDMAGDAVAVMDAVGWPAAHVVGASLGGMIAQLLAVEHPDRVLSLTSVMSKPAPQIGRMRARTTIALVRRAKRLAEEHGRPTTPEAMADFMAAMQEVTGSPAYPADREDHLEMLRVAMGRDDQGVTGPGAKRQGAAERVARDLRAELASVQVPTLVVHGDSDVVIRPVGGEATAAAVPGARLVVHPGMGHELPRALWPRIADDIRAVAGAARTRGTAASPRGRGAPGTPRSARSAG